jgi:hypothetical protein
MIHDSFQIPELANLAMKSTGMDNLRHCNDKFHFMQYDKDISYQYNTRGFRDAEWGDDSLISRKIWCVGDSFTVGLGQPLSERWSSVLQEMSGKPTINIGMNGASNDWIYRKSRYILDNIAPKHLVIQWSYIHRRESTNTTLSDVARRVHYRNLNPNNLDTNNLDNCKNFISAFLDVEKNKGKTTVVHTFIPEWYMDSNILQDYSFWNIFIADEKLCPCLELDSNQLDYARDYHHYDIMTSKKYVKNILKFIQ